MSRRFATQTQVAVEKSRSEINSLLRKWGCGDIQWTDEFDVGRVTLRFTWKCGGVGYMARFAINLEPLCENDFLDGRSGKISERKKQKVEANRGKREHRVLVLWLKAALNAIDAGIVDAAAIFLPFLEDSMGVTVAEFAIPRLQELVDGNVNKMLLSSGKRRK